MICFFLCVCFLYCFVVLFCGFVCVGLLFGIFCLTFGYFWCFHALLRSVPFWEWEAIPLGVFCLQIGFKMGRFETCFICFVLDWVWCVFCLRLIVFGCKPFLDLFYSAFSMC